MYGIAALTAALLVMPAHCAILSVNFGQPGQPVESGFDAWTTSDNTSTSLATTISGIGLTFDPIVSDVSSNNGFRSINRGGNDGYSGSLANLTQTWWGLRAGPSSSGGQFQIILDGADLGAGSFDWTSWHHDQENQTGQMDIHYSVDGGSNWTSAASGFDIIDGDTDGHTGAPNPFSFSFTADGINDVHVRFTNNNLGATTSGDSFALINGFEVVPEPSSVLITGLLGGLFLLRRRRAS